MPRKGFLKYSRICMAGIAAFVVVCIVFIHSYKHTVYRYTAKTPKSTVKSLENITQVPRSKVLIPDNYKGTPCDFSLDLPQQEILQKVESYEFPGIQGYVNDLFQESDERNLPENPVFVTGLSSNHYEEGLAMIYNFIKMVNKNKAQKLIVYDIGLTVEQVGQIEIECRCEVRSFPFHNYPEHVRILKGYSWKPLIIQLVAKKNPFVVWLDTSIRFTTTNIEGMLQAARKHGVLAIMGNYQIADQTSIETFRYLDEPPCLYKHIQEVQAGFTAVYQTPFVKKYIMIPWVSCALVRGCMVPVHNAHSLLNCSGSRHFFHCHRFDQSILGILINMLFHKTSSQHYINDGQYFKTCLDCILKD